MEERKRPFSDLLEKWTKIDNMITGSEENLAGLAPVLEELDELEEISKDESLGLPHQLIAGKCLILMTFRFMRAIGNKADRVSDRLGLDDMAQLWWNDEDKREGKENDER